MSTRVTLALGSNLGDRLATLQQARDYLLTLSVPGAKILQAPIYESAPIDCPPDSPAFYNTVIEIDYAASARELLERTQKIEQSLGRPAEHGHNAPRTVDIDLIHFGEETHESDFLTVPHPRATQRRFVLEPLAWLHPDLVLRGQSKTILELLKESDQPQMSVVSTNW